METGGCGVVGQVVILLVTVVLTSVVLLMARRRRRPAWLLPAFVGAILSGAGAAALLSVVGLLNIVQGVQLSGAGSMAVVTSGLYEANQTWRAGFYCSLLAAVLLSIKYFLLPRSAATATEPYVPRGASLIFTVLPLIGSIVSFVAFQGLNGTLSGLSGGSAPQDLARFVSTRTWMIGISGAATLALCMLNIPLSLALRKQASPSAGAQRNASIVLILAFSYVVIALAMLLLFLRKMTAAAMYGLS